MSTQNKQSPNNSAKKINKTYEGITNALSALGGNMDNTSSKNAQTIANIVKLFL